MAIKPAGKQPERAKDGEHSFSLFARSTDGRRRSWRYQTIFPFFFSTPPPLSPSRPAEKQKKRPQSPKKQTEFGEELKIVTGPSWDLRAAAPMSWNDDHLWSAELDTVAAFAATAAETPSSPPQQQPLPLEFKLVLTRPDGSVEWEGGPNRVLDDESVLAAAGKSLRVSWGFAEVEPVPSFEDAEGEGETAAASAPGASAASPAPEPAAVVASSSEAVLSAMSQFVKSVSAPSSSSSPSPAVKEAEEEGTKEEEEAEVEEVVEAKAPAASAAAAAAVEEAEAATEEASSSSSETTTTSSSGVQSAAAAAALGVGGALLATALAVDLTDAALDHPIVRRYKTPEGGRRIVRLYRTPEGVVWGWPAGWYTTPWMWPEGM